MITSPPYVLRRGSRALSFFALLTVIAVSLCGQRAKADPVVVVDIGGTQFGDGVTIHVDSGATHLVASTAYNYKIEGTIHGTGSLAFLAPNGTNLATFLDLLSAGSSSTLEGTQANPPGTLPFTVIDHPYSGSKSIPFVGTLTASLTIKGSVNAAGTVSFDVTDVSVKLGDVALTDKIVFEPGSKLTVGAPPVIDFQNATANVNESAGTVSLIVERSVNTAGAVSVHYATANGTATQPAHYTTKTGTLNFADGVTTATIDVQIKDNAVVNADRTFFVNLDTPTGGAVLGVAKKETVTILDDESLPGQGTLDFTSAAVTVGEKAGSVVLTVARSQSTVGAITVKYATVKGTALPSRDFRTAAGTLKFADGEATKNISIGIVDDNADNADLVFTVVLSAPGNGGLLGAITTETVTITDNDAASVANFAGSYSLALHKAPFDLTGEGLLTVTLTPTGRFTGALLYGGKRYPLSGGFRLDGSTLVAPIVLSRTGPLKLVLTLANAPQGIQADLQGGTPPVSLATASLALTGFDPANVATRPGKYTVALLPAVLGGGQTPATLPQGAGYCTVTLSPLGAVVVAGKLADGTALSASSFANASGGCSIYAALSGGLGAVFGDLTFRAAAATDDLDGSLRWIRSSTATGALYVGGFDTTLTARGSLFTPPPANTRVIDLPAAVFGLRFGNLGGGIVKSIDIDAKNKVTVTPQPDPNSLKVTLNAKTGLFTGSFREAVGKPSLTFNGALLQKQKSASGYFLGKPATHTPATPIESGAVVLR